MRNNPGENIKIDWQINEIVKPGHVNALTKAIKYDYVVTADKVTKKSSLDEEPDDLYELCGSPAEVNADISILINTTMGVTLRGVHVDESEYIAGPLFKIDPSDFVSAGNSVHIYALCNGVWGGFGIRVKSYRTVLIHTSGRRNAAIFLPGSERISESGIYVGSAWDMDQIDNSAPRGGIVYEQTCDGKLPQGDVTRDAWMSNGMGSGGDDSGRLIIGDYSPADNYSIGNFVIPGTVTNDGLSPDKPIDMSEIHSIKWMPGSIACHTRDSSESLVLKGTIRPYASSISCPFTYHGGASSCRAILIEGNISGGVDSDLCVTGSVYGKVTVSLNDVVFSTTTNGGFSNATITYNGTTYTGESGGWSSDGTVSGSMGSGGYTDAPIKSISVSAPMSNGGIQSNAPTISGGFGSGPSAQVIITFEYNGYEGTIVGEITSGGFTVTMPKIPAITCGFNSDGGFSYTKDASGTSGSLSATISSGGLVSNSFYLPVLYLNTSTMAEDRLYSIRIEYMYDASKDGELPLNRSLDYDAITVPARVGIWTDFDTDGVQALPFGDPSTQNLHSWDDSPCSCVADSVNPQFKLQAPETDLCAIPYAASGWFSPNDTNNIRTWSWGRWYYNESDGSLTVEATKTINETLYTIKVFIIGSHHESHVISSAPYFKLFAVKPSENTTPITKRSVDGSEHRGIIPPRIG